MRDEIVKLARSLWGGETDEGLLEVLCDAACRKLDGMLAPGVKPGDCAEVYLPAAAWLALAWMKDGTNWEGVTSLSAGDMKVSCQGDGKGLEGRALALMAPWLKDENFVFAGVRG